MTAEPTVVAAAGLTAGEEALWLLQRLVPDRGITNVAVSARETHPLRWWPLQGALHWLIARHPALRSGFPAVDGRPARVLHPADEIDAEVDTGEFTEDELPAYLREYAGRPFDLEQPPLMRLGLFLVTAAEPYVCVVIVAHHLIMDAASVRLLLAEIRQLYPAFSTEREPVERPAPVPVPSAPPRAGSLAYWREMLAGFDPAGTRLDPAGAPADPPTFAGDEVERVLSPEVGQIVARLRRRSRSTDAAVLLAAYVLALRSQGASDDALVGLTVNNRGGASADSVGYHIATLPLRIPVDPSAPFDTLAAETARRALVAMEHTDTPFELLAAELTPAGDDPLWWRSRLVRHTFNFRMPPPDEQGPERVMRDICPGLSRFDVELTVERHADTYVARLVYSTELYDATFAAALLERIEIALRRADTAPDRPVGTADLRTPAEVALLDDVNDTARAWPAPGTVPALIASAGTAAPDLVAVVDDGGETTYAELLARAGAVADVLRAHGVRPGDVVGVTGERSAALAAAVLGAWDAGAAYLPLDPDYPPARLAHQIADAGCRIVLDGHRLPEGCEADVVRVPVPRGAASGRDAEPVRPALDDLAYLIYTSGSTGRPKGVRLTHRSLANVVRHFAGVLDAGPRTTMLWLTTFAFDISALELFLPLTVGGRVVVAPDDIRADPDRLLDLFERAGVTAIQGTPTTWRMIAPRAGDRLAGRTALCGGEPLPAGLASALRGLTHRVYNVYGPTETTIWSTVADLAGERPDRITIGRPLANTRIAVLNPAGVPVAVGVAGELCIGGDGVAEGYHGQPELTAKRYPSSELLGRYYRTGDRAVLLADGRVELRGRADRQVKLRGHRIELNEVEAAIEDHPEVSAAAVVLRGDPSGDGYLAAYVAAADRPGLGADVWKHAQAVLPSYALPGRVHRLDALPRTPNGKIDNRALDDLAGAELAAVAEAEPEQTGRIGLLVDAWRDVLGRPGLDRNANFFLNGGTSLLAVQLAQTAAESCGCPVTMGMIFRAPTPAALAALIAGGGAG